MIKMTLAELANILNVSCSTPKVTFTGFSKDTRTLEPSNLYIAIIGEQFDGHQFVEEAYQKGAAAALVSRPVESDIPQILVNDTILAAGKISANWRNRFSLPLVGVTGSNGKTTLKNMIASILCAACEDDKAQVLATEGNLNNQIGVPFMLARLNSNQRFGVIEMGMNNFGEIAYLTQLTRPVVAVVNNAAIAHLQGLKDVAGVARAKGEIFQALEKDGVAVLNRDDTFFDYWNNLVTGHATITFGMQEKSDVSATLTPSQNTSHQLITLHTPKGTAEVVLPLLGEHNIMNALAATAATLALGMDLQTIKAGLENVIPAPGRLNQHLLPSGARLIDDSYNANPHSLEAAINTLSIFHGKKILVLGDMKELGPDAKALHATMGEKAQLAGIDHLFTYGELSAAATESFGQNAQHFTDREKLINALKPHLLEGSTVLIKGSHSMHMEKVVEKLIPETKLAGAH